MTSSTDKGKRNAGDTRDTAIRLRSWLWDLPRPASFSPRVAECGRKRVSEWVEVKSNGETSGLGGLSTCGSVWHCPCCSAKVAGTRSVELADTFRAWTQAGGAVVLVTLTLSHRKGHRLAKTWDALGHGWASVRNGNGWKADVARFGIAGYVRVIEVTHGANGWHPHAHVVLFVDQALNAEECEQLRGRLYSRWSNRLAKEGYRTLEFDPETGKPVGVDVRQAGPKDAGKIADYVAKFGYTPKAEAAALALEAARGDLKTGRKGSRTPWQILEAAAAGDAESERLWREWEKASHGRRQYAWAAGFRDRLDLASVLTDQEAAEREDAHLDVVALVTAPAWTRLVENLRAYRNLPGAPLMSRMLDRAATLDGPAFRAWLTAAGIEHHDPAAVAAAGAGQEVLPEVEPGTYAARHARQLKREQVHRERLRQPLDRTPARVAGGCRVCGGRLAPELVEFGRHLGECWHS